MSKAFQKICSIEDVSWNYSDWCTSSVWNYHQQWWKQKTCGKLNCLTYSSSYFLGIKLLNSLLIELVVKHITSINCDFRVCTCNDQTWTVLSNEELNRKPPTSKKKRCHLKAICLLKKFEKNVSYTHPIANEFLFNCHFLPL